MVTVDGQDEKEERFLVAGKDGDGERDGRTAEMWTGLRLCRTILWIARGRLQPCPVALCRWLLCGVGHQAKPDGCQKEPGNRIRLIRINPGLD